MSITINELEEKLLEVSKEITFESEVLEQAPKMSGLELQNAIDHRIELVSNPKTNIEVKERVSKEARVMALMKLRRMD
jgi:hypothetical protein